jgi:two-component system phosphate regulon sensor histidine kinase PhoR
MDADPVAREETLRAIARESERMGRIVSDLLTLARADAGQPLERRHLALDSLVLEVYTQEQTLANGVRLQLGEWDQIAVEGDPDRLKQVMLNLVDNALRYTPSGGEVTLDLLQRGDEAVFQVHDTGPGIPAEQMSRIFDRFYRVDQPRTRGAGGTGLGLAIAREVAEAHGGRIDVESHVGEGSTFALVLPVARSADEPGRSTQPQVQGRPAASPANA